MLMRRRKFIVLLGGAAVAGPVAGWAQPGKVPRIGILVLGNLDPAPFLKEFREGLRELGYVEGQNDGVRIPHGGRDRQEARRRSPPSWSRSRSTSSSRFQTPAVTAAKQATAEIPIVMA